MEVINGAAIPGGATGGRREGERPFLAPGSRVEPHPVPGGGAKEGAMPGLCPEQQLWCAVIVHTLYEATGRIGYAERGERDSVRDAAVAWFEDGGADFESVCDLAGLIPSAVRDGALRVIREGRLPRIRIAKSGRGSAKAAGPEPAFMGGPQLATAAVPAAARG